MKKNFILTLFFTVTLSYLVSAQSFRLDWNSSFSPAWVAGTTSHTANNVGTSGVNVTVSFANTAAASTYQSSTPAVGNPGSTGWTLPTPTTTGSMVLWVDWANTAQKITATITFSSPVANPSFYVGDIDKSDATIGVNDNYIDRVTVTGTTPGGATLNSVASKFNAGSTIVQVSANSARANSTVNQGGNAPTNAATGAAQDGTALFTITGTVSSVTLVYDNFNNTASTVNPTGQAVNLGDITFSKTVPISGTVFNDVNGNQAQNGAETGIRPVTLYVNVIDVATNTVIGVATVNTDGTYSAPNVASGSTVSLVLSTTAGTPGATPPAAATISGYANTTPLTLASLSTGTTGLSGQNFGLDQLPVPGTAAMANQVNPGGTISTIVPPGTFSATDPDGGTITSIRITAFPTNVTSITINGTLYTAVNFPGGGVIVPTNAAGVPTQTISVDPIDGIITVQIPYRATDNAGGESTVSGQATIPYLSVLPVKLISFTGNIVNSHAQLTWRTGNEQGVSNYIIEKSLDGVSFTTAGEIASRNLTGEQQYLFTDGTEIFTTSYYRIRITDANGRISYSAVIRITTENKNNEITNVVNPFNANISFQYNSTVGQVIVFVLVDAGGKTIKANKQAVTTGANSIMLGGMETLAAGTYFLKITGADNTTHTLTLLKK